MIDPSTTGEELRIAVVGAGPAGFFVADELLDASGADVTIFDRLPTPWGLVRAGVAPDHPNIKSVTRTFERVAQREGVRFIGNVDVGVDISHEELLRHFHAVVYTYGVSRDRSLEIPGETLPGSYSAADFVAWYNGHPDAADLSFDLSGPKAVVVGNGNVALDVARMLLRDEEQLRTTDASDAAIEVLAGSGIKEVVILGRRGPAQASYTAPVLLEFGKLPNVRILVAPEDSLDDASAELLAGDKTARRAQENLNVARNLVREQGPGASREKLLTLQFLRSPTRVLGESRVTGIEVATNKLGGSPGARHEVTATDHREVIGCSAIFRAIGYRGHAINGLPFDPDTGTLPNDQGRVLDSPRGAPLPGVYTAGWVKRGPSGVIGTNKKCASETVSQLLGDYESGRLEAPRHGVSELTSLLAARSVVQVDDAAWQRIDKYERAMGLAEGRPRVKLTQRKDLIKKALDEPTDEGSANAD